RRGVPLAARRREEVSAVDVDRRGDAVELVGDGVYDVGAQPLRFLRLQLAGAVLREALRAAPEERIVLAAAVDADDRPHAVVMRPHRHARSPGEIEYREV